MRILTHVTFHWRYGWLSATEESYNGPVAFAGGGGTTVENETVPTGPFGPQIPFILSLFNQAADLYSQGPPQAFPGEDATPGINPNIQNTQDAIGGLAGGNIDQNNAIQQFLQALAGSQNPGALFGEQLTGLLGQGLGDQLNAGNNPLAAFYGDQGDNAGGAYGTIFGQGAPSAFDPGQTQAAGADVDPALGQLLAGGGGINPYLEQLIQGQIQGQTDSFNRNVLPGIRTEAQQAGQIGGTRQGIGEGIAANDLIQSIGNTTGNIYGNAFNTQAGLQGQAVGDVIGAQGQNQAAGIQAQGLNNQNYQQYIQSLLQGTGQYQSGLGQGLGLGYDAIGTGTAQAGNLFGQGNSLQLQQQLQSLGLIPGFQAGSLGQLGGVNQLGLQQYGLDQNAINAMMEQYYFNQNSPFNLLSQFQQYISGPYGSTVGNFGGNPYADLFNGGGGYNPYGPGYPYNPYGQAGGQQFPGFSSGGGSPWDRIGEYFSWLEQQDQLENGPVGPNGVPVDPNAPPQPFDPNAQPIMGAPPPQPPPPTTPPVNPQQPPPNPGVV